MTMNVCRLTRAWTLPVCVFISIVLYETKMTCLLIRKTSFLLVIFQSYMTAVVFFDKLKTVEFDGVKIDEYREYCLQSLERNMSGMLTHRKAKNEPLSALKGRSLYKSPPAKCLNFARFWCKKPIYQEIKLEPQSKMSQPNSTEIINTGAMQILNLERQRSAIHYYPFEASMNQHTARNEAPLSENVLQKLLGKPQGNFEEGMVSRNTLAIENQAIMDVPKVLENDRLQEIEALDLAEEQANLDLVQGINLMVAQNQTLDEVVDEVLEDHNEKPV